MTNSSDPRPVHGGPARHLHRHDRARNMARFYILSVMPDLFGDVMLLRQWGRIGTSGQCLVERLPDPSAAFRRIEALAQAKRRRGYLDVSPDKPA